MWKDLRSFRGLRKIIENSESHLARAFSTLPLRPQVSQLAVPDFPARPPAGLNQIFQCPCPNPCFSAQPASQASPYNSRSIQRSSHFPVCGACCPDLPHGS